MKKSVTIEAIVGFCAFLALMCGGFYWLLSICQVQWNFLQTIKWVCSIILTVIAVICGWIWINSTKINKTAKIVIDVFFVIFAVLAVIGYIQF